ncbi:MAG: helix-turn-helix domain-containing protein [Planctomycetes bacterium]|nr:helix-turn-helix domain-containing protein [Planctomycetota bacterium]
MELGVREVAKLLNVAEKAIYRWLGQGTIPAYRVNNTYRFNRAELLEWATSRQISVSAELFEEPNTTTMTSSLSESLKAGEYPGRSMAKPPGMSMAAPMSSVNMR